MYFRMQKTSQTLDPGSSPHSDMPYWLCSWKPPMSRQALGIPVTVLSGTPTAHIGGSSPGSALNSSFPLMCTLGSSREDSKARDSQAIPVGDSSTSRSLAFAFRLLLHPILVVVGTWGNEPMDQRSLPLSPLASLFLKQIWWFNNRVKSLLSRSRFKLWGYYLTLYYTLIVICAVSKPGWF